MKWSFGLKKGSPELNCCACGGGAHKDTHADPATEEENTHSGPPTCASENPCQNHGVCEDDEINGPECECVGGFSGKHCEIDPVPGKIINKDPATPEAQDMTKLALAALNEKRVKSELTVLTLEKIISYQQQEVAGTLHMMCLKTVEEGYVKVVWDDFTFGEGPHLSSVAPLSAAMKWAKKTDSTYMCSDLILGRSIPKGDDNAFLEELLVDTEKSKFTQTLKKAASKEIEEIKKVALLEEKNGLPENWDAREDHARSAACKDLINQPANQGTCGSCYAFGALGAASISACIAGHNINKGGFSIQDVLSCGSIWEGDFQNNVAGAVVHGHAHGQTFAGNCGGHWPGNVFEYATKYGLVDAECQRYAHAGVSSFFPLFFFFFFSPYFFFIFSFSTLTFTICFNVQNHFLFFHTGSSHSF